MEDPKHPESESPAPARPQFLDYRGPVMHPDRPRMTGGQIGAGFGCWILSVGGAYGSGMAFQSGWAALFGWLLVLVPSSVYFAGRLRWRGFVPGVLIGAALTCLVPLGIVAALCFNR